MNARLHKAIVGAVVSSCGIVVAASQSQDAGSATAALQMFSQKVAAYSAIHQHADALLPPQEPTADVHAILRRQHTLASAIIAARPYARQGDIFTPEVAGVLRGLVSDALVGIDVDLMLSELYEECEMPVGYRPRVHAAYPDWATHQMPTALLAELPALPEGIMYRLIDHDLLLWDGNANVIIDVLPDALPRSES